MSPSPGRSLRIAGLWIALVIGGCGAQTPAAVTTPGATVASATVPSPSATPTSSALGASPTGPAGGTTAGASVHLTITGGKYPGTYDFQAKNGCASMGPGAGWAVSYDDPAQTPTNVDLQAGTDFDSLTVGFGKGQGYFGTSVKSQVGQANGATTLTVTADAIDLGSYGADGTKATIELKADCGGSGVAATPFVIPTPRVQGTPAPGSTVFHMVVGFGPSAGTYDAWTTQDACGADDVTFAASFADPGAIPNTVTLVGVIGDGSTPPDGSLTVIFGSGADSVVYTTSPGAAIGWDATGRATVSDAQATSSSFDGSTATGSLDATITCATVHG